MNCSLILEEFIRESKDMKKDVYIAFLDAKSAFDVVDHASLMRRLFHIGVDGALWNLIYSLHSNAQTAVRVSTSTKESDKGESSVPTCIRFTSTRRSIE